MLRLHITGTIIDADPPITDHVTIGRLDVRWEVDGKPRTHMAAILRVSTGGAPSLAGWGRDRLALRWIGDMPDPDIAQSVYDWLADRGPAPGGLAAVIDSLPASPDAPSYRPARLVV